MFNHLTCENFIVLDRLMAIALSGWMHKLQKRYSA